VVLFNVVKINKYHPQGYKWKYIENTVNIFDEKLYEKDEHFFLINNIYDDKFENYAISNYGKIINIKKIY
jgi:hypothetical protein